MARISETKKKRWRQRRKKLLELVFSSFSFHEWGNLCFISFSSPPPVRNGTLRSYLHNLLREKEGWCRTKRKMAQDASNEEKGGKAIVSRKKKKSFFVFLCGKKDYPPFPPKKGIQRGLLLLALQEHRGEHCLSSPPPCLFKSLLYKVCMQ